MKAEIVGELGVTGDTVKTTDPVVIFPEESVTETVTVKGPVAVGVQRRVFWLAVAHPAGSPIYA